MDPRTAKFIVFLGFGLAAFFAGALLRRHRSEYGRLARPVHFYTILLFWAPIGCIGFWRLPIDDDLIRLALFQPLLMIAMGVLVYIALGIFGPRRPSRETSRGFQGELILAGSLNNVGFAMGAYLCYVLFADGEVALGYGIAVLTIMQVATVLFFYPVADYYGEGPANLARAMRDSLVSLRAAPIYAAPVGLSLNLLGVPFPREALVDTYLLDGLFFAGAAGGYLGIGLNFRLQRPAPETYRLHAFVFAMKFVLSPLVALGILGLMSFAGLGPSSLVRNVLLLEAAMPVAIMASMVSNLFGLRGELASELWFYNTLLFGLLPLGVLILLFQGAG